MKKIYVPLLFFAQIGFAQCDIKTSCDKDQVLNIDQEGLSVNIDMEEMLKDLPKLKDPYRDDIRFNVTLFVDGKRIHKVYNYYKKSDDESIYQQAANSKKLEVVVIPDQSYDDKSMNDDLSYMGELLGKMSPGKHKLEIKFGPSGQYKKAYLCSKIMEIELSKDTPSKIDALVAQIKSNADNEQADELVLPEARMTNEAISKQIGSFYSDEYGAKARVIISDKEWTVFKDGSGIIKYKYVHTAATWKKDGKNYVDFNLVSQKFDGKKFSGPYDLQKNVNPKLITIK